MSLDFNTSGRLVNHGSGSSLDDIPGGGTLSVWAWVYRASNGGNQHIVTKDNSFPSGWSLLCDNGSGEGEIRFLVFGSSTGGSDWTDAISATGTVPLNTWTFVAASFDDAATPEARVYAGSLTSAVTEVSYFRQQDGTGSPVSDAAASLYVGNLQRSTAYPFLGRIARVGVVAGALTLAELRRLQYAPISQCHVSGTRLLASYGGAGVTQADLSGNGNNGTVTSAVDAAHVPLGPVYAAQDYSNVVAAAAAATTRGMPFATRGTAFNGGRTWRGIINSLAAPAVGAACLT